MSMLETELQLSSSGGEENNDTNSIKIEQRPPSSPPPPPPPPLPPPLPLPGGNFYLNDDLLIKFKSNENKNLTVVPIDKEAPTYDNWYHGRMDRARCEELMLKNAKPGSFLVRESERTPRSFVLSYYSLSSIIHHFKIKPIFGVYYIGQRHFDKLETLVSYYMYYSELVKGEKLMKPVEPDVIQRLDGVYVSMTTRTATTASALVDGQLRNVLEVDKVGMLFRGFHECGLNGEWLWAQSYATGECGLLSAECVQRVDDDKLHEIEPWFYSGISKEDAVAILANAGNLSFLVRPSDQSHGDYTLFFNADNIIHRFRIESTSSSTSSSSSSSSSSFSLEADSTLTPSSTSASASASSSRLFHIGGRRFTSIVSIVERYMSEEICDGGYRLSRQPHHLLLAAAAATTTARFANDVLLSSPLLPVQQQQQPLTMCTASLLNVLGLIKHQNIITEAQTTTTAITPLSPAALVEKTAAPTTDYLMVDTTTTNSKMSKSASVPLNNVSPKKITLAVATAMQQSLNTIETANKKKPVSRLLVHSKSAVPDFLNHRKNFRKRPTLFPANLENDSNLLKGHLYRYNEKTKKWKYYFFVIDENTQQLNYYSTEKKSLKEKGTIDLTQSFYYPLDNSFFNRPFCFQIIVQSQFPNTLNGKNLAVKPNTVHYLSADNLKTFKIWSESIGSLCNPIQYNPFSTTRSNSSSSSSGSGSSSSTCPSISQTTTSESSYASSSMSISSSSTSSSSSSSSPSTSPTRSSSSTTRSYKQSTNYRILRTLHIDVHEARNLNLLLSSSSSSSYYHNHQHNQPQYFYCVLMLNEKAFVASTRLTTPPAHQQQSTYPSSSSSTSSGSSLESSSSTSTSSSSSSSSGGHTTTQPRDAIWDDSFTFDSLPLDVAQLRLCLFGVPASSGGGVGAKTASVVNNLRRFGGGSGTNGANLVMNNISSAVTNAAHLAFNMGSNSKTVDPSFLGYVNIRLDDQLMNRGLCESWYKVEPASTFNQVPSATTTVPQQQQQQQPHCSMRIKVRFCQETIHLDDKDDSETTTTTTKTKSNKGSGGGGGGGGGVYARLSDYLLDPTQHKHLCHVYDQIVTSSERAHLVHALLRFFIVKARIVAALKSFLSAEIARCADLATLFRPATLCTSLMDQYMRVRCHRFLIESLEQPLARVWQHTCSDAQQANSFELDPSKCTDAVQREHNLAAFKSAMRDLVTSICSPQAVDAFPVELKHLFWLVRHKVQAKWLRGIAASTTTTTTQTTAAHLSDDKLVRVYCVSAFVFLRLLCPAMISPKSFGLKFGSAAVAQQQAAQKLYCCHLDEMSSQRFDHVSLGAQFNVFSPSYMFDLQPRTRLRKSRTLESQQSSLAMQQQHQQAVSIEQINCFNMTTSLAATAATSAFTNTSNNSGCLNNVSSSSSLYVQTYERHVKMLAKVLQTMANMTECKEPYMQPLSEFLSQNKSRIVNFIDQIAAATTIAASSTTTSAVERIDDDQTEVDEEDEEEEEDDDDESTLISENDDDGDELQESAHVRLKYAECKYLAIIYRLLSSCVPQMRSYLVSVQSHEPSDVEFAKSLKTLIAILGDIGRKTKSSSTQNQIVV